MNAETRAKELLTGMLDKVYCEGGDAFPIFEETLPLIAAAITRAENDKLEEAALAAEQSHLGMSCFVDAVDCGQFNSGVRHAAKAVRSLLEKD